MKKIIISIFIFITLLVPNIGHGQIDNALLENIKKSSNVFNTNTNPNVLDQSINTKIGDLIEYILSFAGVIFLILMIIASFIWITAQGDKAKITSAKKLLTNGVIGAFISFGSFIIVSTMLMPLSERYFTPVNFTSGGSNITLSEIYCDNNIQCADQPTRQMCFENNCVECLVNDVSDPNGTAMSYVCTDIYGGEKNVCDTVNHVCMPDPSEPCGNLSLNSCLTRNDCRWQYSFKEETFGNAVSNFGIGAVGENTLNWLGVNTANDNIGGSCKTQADYKCEEQCGIEKPFCLTEFASPRCVECRTDADCAGNLLAKKCSTMSGNYVCSPF